MPQDVSVDAASPVTTAAVMTHRLITFWRRPFFGWLAIRDLAHRKFI